MRILRATRSTAALAWTALLLGVLGSEVRADWVFEDPAFFTETVATLPPFAPVGVTWAPDGRMFVWTKNGTVRIVKNGALLTIPFLDISNKVNTLEDRGLLGLAVDPDYAVNGYVYLLYTYEEGGNPNSNSPKVSLLTRVTSDPANRDVALAGSEVTILGSTATIPCPPPSPTNNCIPSDHFSHSIGTLRAGAGGKLWVSVGDGASYNLADPRALRSQDLDSLAGKILRIDFDGTAPGDNPFDDGTNSVRSKVWAYGLRNPYRFNLHPLTNVPLIGEVGWVNWEEVNRADGGENFGWPCYEGIGPQLEYQAAFSACQSLSSNLVDPPLYTYFHDAAGGSAAIGGPFYQGDQYPSVYTLNYFWADYPARWVRRMVFDTAGNLLSVLPFASDIGTAQGGLVSLELGPDGLMYYVEFTTGVIGRIRHTGGGAGNQAPVAVASGNPPYGYTPLTVDFSSTGSFDPEGFALSYLWDFGDGATSTEANPTHTYSPSGVATFTVALNVTDNQGLASATTTSITVGSLPPEVTIDAPADGTEITPGQTIDYMGSATDADDGTLPDIALEWTILVHHNTHVHVLSEVSGSSGSVLIEDHDPSGFFWYGFILTATDSSGLSTSESVLLPLLDPLGGPAAALGMNEGSGTSAADASGNGHTGTLVNGPAWGAGQYGNGIVFDGVNDSVSVAGPSTIDLAANFTVMTWFKRNALGGGQRHLLSKCGTAWTSGCKELYFTAGNQLAFGSFATGDVLSTVVADTAWHHVAVTFTRSTNTVQIYLDGTLETTSTRVLEADDASHAVTIGNQSGTNPFSGTIDEMRIYSRALAAGEILTARNAPIEPTPDTTAPVLSNGQPTGTLPAGTTATTLGVATDESATCRYSTNPGVSYGSMSGTFGTTGGTAHSTSVTGLADGQSYNYFVRCQDVWDNANLVDFPIGFAVAVPDSTLPTVSLTAPADGATVSGTLTVSATADDNIGVVGVQFLLDGASLGAEDTTSPYSVSWSTISATNGAHILSARARDIAGNQATATDVAVTVANVALPDLVAALGMNEGSGTSAADASGNGHTGTLVNGPAWGAGQYGNGIVFDGVNDSVSVAGPSTIDLAANFTVMTWFKRNALGGGQRHLLSKCGTAWTSGCKELYFTAGNQLAFGSFATGDVLSTVVADTAWHHVAVTFTRSTNTVQIYLDGTLETTSTRVLEADDASHPVTIGNQSGTNPFSGTIDEMRIYSRALAAGEILTARNAPIEPTPDTTAPVLSNGQPTGTLPAGTTATTLGVATDESATCRYSTNPGVSYGSMSGTFGTTGGTAHSTSVTGLADGQSYNYFVRCQDVWDNANLVDFPIGFAVAVPDSTLPTVSLTAPADGATVSGTLTVSATADDNIGVVGVQFLLDGASLGAEDTTSPYSVSWSTISATNGAHILSARARDIAGNQATATDVAVTVANVALPDLVAALGMNEVSGTSAADASGNGHTGTLVNGPVWGAGQYGNGIVFDGVNDSVSVAGPSTIDLAANFTVMTWFKRNALGGGQRHLLSKCGTGWTSGCKELYVRPNNQLAFGSFATGDVLSTAVADTAWHHVAVTFTRSTNTVQIYLDGTLRTTSTRVLEADNASHSVTIGNQSGTNPFSGTIDEMRIYSRALSAGEILTARNAPIEPTPDTTAPVLSNGQPTGTLPAGTTATTLGVATDESATCRYSTNPGVSYGSMSGTFGTTGGTAHSTSIAGLADGQSYNYFVRCQDVWGNANLVDYPIGFAVAVPDSTLPTVSLTAPAAGATVSGTVTVSATADDNIGVVGVQFLLDGASLGAEDTTSPYSIGWSTISATNGAHILSARARDIAGNQATATDVAVTVSNVTLPDLVAALGMNEGSGPSAADASGNGHTGTLVNGPAWGAGQYGNGIVFDGVNDSVSVAGPSTIDLAANFTVMTWFKRNALGGGQRHLLSKCGTGWTSGCKELYVRPNNQLAFGSFATGDVLSTAVADTAWHHVAVTFTRSTNTVQIYLDGTLRTTSTRVLEADNASHSVTIGNQSGTNPFSGTIDEMQIYSRALDAAEILTARGTPIP